MTAPDPTPTATPRSTSTSRARRSYPNLHNLSLAPLSSTHDLPDDPASASTYSPSSPSRQTPHTSYIAHKSAPTTPGILSRDPSLGGGPRRHHNKNHVTYAYNDTGSYFSGLDRPRRDVGDIPKAKSTDGVAFHGVSFAGLDGEGDEKRHRHHERKRTGPARIPLVRHHTSESASDWFHRAGLAIAGETRDSKGQGWLVSRESSTSLAVQAQAPDAGTEESTAMQVQHAASRMGSRGPSRVGSRVVSCVPSAVHSRRGSKAGSRVDLLAGASGGLKTPTYNEFEMAEEGEGPGFDDTIQRGFSEPDFVHSDNEAESDGDEEEVARLARQQGFGLGSWMDRLIGWTLFSVDEDGEESSEDETENATEEGSEVSGGLRELSVEDLKLRREVEARRRKMEREAVAKALEANMEEQMNRHGEGEARAADENDEEGGGWKDAAWLFSVASKVIL